MPENNILSRWMIFQYQEFRTHSVSGLHRVCTQIVCNLNRVLISRRQLSGGQQAPSLVDSADNCRASQRIFLPRRRRIGWREDLPIDIPGHP
jgi:hypothetical protein